MRVTSENRREIKKKGRGGKKNEEKKSCRSYRRRGEERNGLCGPLHDFFAKSEKERETEKEGGRERESDGGTEAPPELQVQVRT